jgi:hypothetical protein
MVKAYDISELIQAHEKSEINEPMGHWQTIVNSIDFLLETKENTMDKVETIYGTEAIYEKIKISIEKLADNLPKQINKTNSLLKEQINMSRTNLNKLEKKYPEIDAAIENLSEDDLKKITITDSLSFEDYKKLHENIYKLFGMEKKLPFDITKTKVELTSSTMSTIIEYCKDIYLDIVEDPMSNSGYSFNVSKEYSNLFNQDPISLKSLNYDKKNIKKIYADIKHHKKEMNKNYKENLISDIKHIAVNILTDFNKIRSNNIELTAKKITSITIQLCRCYFYLNFFTEFYNVINWGPFHSSINLFEQLVKQQSENDLEIDDSLDDTDDKTDDIDETE